MMTLDSFRKDFSMMVLRQRFLNDGTKSFKRFLTDFTKNLKRFLNDGNKKV